MKYKAFISYRHGGVDEQIAVKLHKEIEKYHVPGRIAKHLGENRLGRVFRDADELEAASDLSAAIREALNQSEWLIVIATPRYLESKWCLEEIDFFMKLRGRERILVVLAEGEPEDSFPSQLTGEMRDGVHVDIEPLAVDVRGETLQESLKKVKQERFRLFAPMLGVAYDDLRQRQRETRLRRVAVLTGAVFLILGGVIVVISMKNIQLNRAYDALDQSNRKTLQSESYYLAEYADKAYQNGDTQTALLLDLEALPEDLNNPERPFVTQVMRSLTQALGVYDYSDGYKPGAFFEREGETYDLRTQVSTDGSRVRIEGYTYAAGNILNREVQVCSLPDGKELCRYTLSPVSRTVDHADAAGSYLTKDGQRLIFLAEDGLHYIEVETGRELFFKPVASDELKVGDKEETIVTIDYEGHRLYSFNRHGEMRIDCNLGGELNYTLGDISPLEKQVALATNTESMAGVVTIDLKTGDTPMIQMPGLCSCVRFIDEDRLCFLLSDESDGLKHIVQYNLKEGDQGYLCNADWDMTTVTLTGRDTCLYYHNNRLYEVDCDSRRGEKIWEQVFSSSVVSVAAGDGVIAVSCSDGSITFFDGISKKKLSEQPGNGEAYTVLTVDQKTATLRDFWGKNLRVYRKENRPESPVFSLKGITSLKAVPDKWYTCGALENAGFMLGFRKPGEDILAIFTEEESQIRSDSAASLRTLGLSSFDNLSVELRDYLWVQDYADDSILHIDRNRTRVLMKLSSEDNYYYSEDGNTVCVTGRSGDKNILKTYDACTGKETRSVDIGPDDRGFMYEDVLVTGDDESIRIHRSGSKADEQAGQSVELSDAVLYGFNQARGLVFYRSVDEKKWFVYDLNQNKNVCGGSSGTFTNTEFFGENRYMLNDYRVVYDMDTWEPVLDLSELGNSVYGVMTTASLPYFVVWCQENEADDGDRSSGSGTAYLYEKNGDGSIVGQIPNFVSMTPEGRILVYDGAYDLYEFELLSAEELKSLAEKTVAGRTLTAEQRERYHLY